jgi:Ni,Fe-hydrogenase III component G
MTTTSTSKNADQETVIAEALRRELKENLVNESRMSPDRPVFEVRKDALTQALKVLVDGFDARLCTITALDNGVDFELIYHMAVKALVLNIKVIVPKEDSEVASVTGIIPGAISAEREIWDLFQIKFQGITDSRAYIAPYEWREVKAPLRKPMSGVVGSYQKPTVERMMQAGQVFPIPSTIMKQRDELKLPPIVSTTTRPEAVEELHKIAHEVGFDKKIGYDTGKNKLRY